MMNVVHGVALIALLLQWRLIVRVLLGIHVSILKMDIVVYMIKDLSYAGFLCAKN